ncbi:MAG TPA: PIG-L family deacetylase [Solirubrobacteraceae bacterium]|nr:PIG-L family deacetylase [Solirubrobacteraceae bacterium]
MDGFVSPHFDDAVLSCARQIATRPGSTVVTVFSGGPDRVDPLTAWDENCGFAPGDDVPAVRAQEDEDALSSLQARASGLAFWDGQYRSGSPSRLVRAVRARLGTGRLVPDIAETLGGVVEDLGLETVFIPLGISHPDHKLTAQACLQVARVRPQTRWMVYEDLPYARESAEAREAAVAAVAAAGFTLEPLALGDGVDLERKRTAIECYRSQLKALGARVEVALSAPERYHRLVA